MGEGHNSAANALLEECKLQGHTAELLDPLSLTGGNAQNITSSLYNNTIRTVPLLFGAVYKAGRLYEATGLPSPIYAANTLYAQKLADYISKNRFDAAIATHLFGMDALSEVKRKFLPSFPSFAVLTDYARIPLFAEPRLLDGYFIGHGDIAPQLTDKGIDQSRIFCTGIPTAPKFRERMSKNRARELLGIPKRKTVWLVMSGGIGGGNVKGLCKNLLDASPQNVLIYVLVGRNLERAADLKREFGASGRLVTVPFTDQVNLYMNAADILLSKPGGLSTTEAAVANVPIIHINAIPGCETENKRFFEERKMSRCAKNTQEAALFANQLSANPSFCEKMKANQRKAINPFASTDIIRKVLEYVE